MIPDAIVKASDRFSIAKSILVLYYSTYDIPPVASAAGCGAVANMAAASAFYERLQKSKYLCGWFQPVLRVAEGHAI